jgi:hypothetical protein
MKKSAIGSIGCFSRLCGTTVQFDPDEFVLFFCEQSVFSFLPVNWFTCCLLINESSGRAMGRAVSRRPPTADARVQSQVSPCGLCDGQSGTGTGFSQSTSVFPCQFHSTGAPLLGKGQKIIIIIIFIFIVGLNK